MIANEIDMAKEWNKDDATPKQVAILNDKPLSLEEKIDAMLGKVDSLETKLDSLLEPQKNSKKKKEHSR